MKVDEDSGGMWCLVMFDLPVKTKVERHAATVSYTHLTLPTSDLV